MLFGVLSGLGGGAQYVEGAREVDDHRRPITMDRELATMVVVAVAISGAWVVVGLTALIMVGLGIGIAQLLGLA